MESKRLVVGGDGEKATRLTDNKCPAMLAGKEGRERRQPRLKDDR